jgi:hypothetical protein
LPFEKLALRRGSLDVSRGRGRSRAKANRSITCLQYLIFDFRCSSLLARQRRLSGRGRLSQRAAENAGSALAPRRASVREQPRPRGRPSLCG